MRLFGYNVLFLRSYEYGSDFNYLYKYANIYLYKSPDIYLKLKLPYGFKKTPMKVHLWINKFIKDIDDKR